MSGLDTEFVEDQVYSTDEDDEQGQNTTNRQPQQKQQQEQQYQQRNNAPPAGRAPRPERGDKRPHDDPQHQRGPPNKIQPPSHPPQPPPYQQQQQQRFGPGPMRPYGPPPGPRPPPGPPPPTFNGPGPSQEKGVTYEQYMSKHGMRPPPPESSPAVERRMVDPAHSILVGNLEWWVTDVEVRDTCAEAGPVRTLRFAEDAASGMSRGWCLVEFNNREAAENAVQKLQGVTLYGKKLIVALRGNMPPVSEADVKQLVRDPPNMPNPPRQPTPPVRPPPGDRIQRPVSPPPVAFARGRMPFRGMGPPGMGGRGGHFDEGMDGDFRGGPGMMGGFMRPQGPRMGPGGPVPQPPRGFGYQRPFQDQRF